MALRTRKMKLRTKIAAFAMVVPLGAAAFVANQPASASDFPFAYTIHATTHLKKLNQTVTVPPGTFVGNIDFDTGELTGTITLPPATITMKLAGIVPLVTATVKIIPSKPVTGHVSLDSVPFPITATSTFYIRITSAYAGVVPVNLVGNDCITADPIVVTMSGTASPGASSTFSGVFTMPKLKTCGQAITQALNQVFPGPGNTFTATADPQ